MRVPKLTVVLMGHVPARVRVLICRRHQAADEHHRGQALPNSQLAPMTHNGLTQE
jgi:hypothetical protein